jgi:quinol monooxygenase YgiN
LSVTIMCELRVRPEHVDPIIQQALEQLSLPSSSVAGRRFARLYQHVDDPTRLLYVGEWDSREAFEAYCANARQPGRVDQFQQPPLCRVYRRLALFERMLTPVGLAYADIVDGPPESHAARRDLALAYHRTSLRSHTSLALLMIHEAVDDPAGLLIVSGWQSDAPLSQATPSPDDRLIGQLRDTGATVGQFVGRTLAEAHGG